MTDNPVTAAMEAYLRTHPHREGDVEAAFETFDPNAEDSGVEEVALPFGQAPAELTPAPEQLSIIPPVPPTLDLADLPELPPGKGLTAMEAAERLAEDWRRRETLRRRVQELCNPYRMLQVVGIRLGASTGSENHVYAATKLGLEALAAWDAGQSWEVTHLVRREDPETAQTAARKIKPGVDFHRVLSLYASL